MKKILSALFLVAVLQELQATEVGDERPAQDSSSYVVNDRGPNHRVWQRTELVTGPDGVQRPVVHSYTELATGMHYQDDSGQWVESKAEIDILPNGAGAAATHGQHKVIFPPDLYSGQIELHMLDDKWLRSQVVGLSYFDTASSQSVLIAQVTNSVGELVSSNVLIYPNAFTDFSADVRYTYTKAGLEQDIILRQQPPSPAAYGLNPGTTRLQVLTEFFSPPSPQVQDLSLQGVPDELLDFGAMKIGQGKAFALEGDATSGLGRVKRDALPVTKQWSKLEGRDFLVEEVDYQKAETKLQSLLPAPVAMKRQPGLPTSALHRVVAGRALPAPRMARQGTNTFQVARSKIASKPGYVLDYQIGGSSDNYTFRGNMTYFINGGCGVGSPTVFEGGTVIKYSPDGYMDTYGDINCKTGPYRPAVFTSMNDDSVGELISGSTGSPQYTDDYNYFLYPGASGIVLHDLRFTHAFVAIPNCNNIQFWNCVFLDLYYVVEGSSGYVGFYNCLIADQPDDVAINTDYSVLLYGCDVTRQNVTSVGDNVWDVGGGIDSQANNLNFSKANFATNTCFQTVGGGRFYLTNGSSFRNSGTTNIDPVLMAQLRGKTTYPPIVYFNTNLTGPSVLGPQVQRDGDIPDWGYHYDPMDYVFGGCAVSTNLTFTAGTSVGWFHASSGYYHAGQGIHIESQKILTFDGTATAPTYWVRANTVQEGGPNWSGGYGTGGITSWADQYDSITNAAEVHARYLRVTGLTSFDTAFRDDWGFLIGRFKDCEFYNSGCGVYVSSYYFTNCLFERVGVGINEGHTNNEFVIKNCTWHGGVLNIIPSYTAIFNLVKDCAFDATSIAVTNYGTNLGTYDFNAYTNTANLFPTGCSNDQHGVSFNWQSGPLGNYYLPSDSVILNTGSTNAAMLGLYHFTTQTNQVKESNSVVDIGYHYVVTDGSGNPIDTDGDGLPDYLEDVNGNGALDLGETSVYDYYNGVLSVTNGLALWLRADFGITNEIVNQWSDRTTNHNDATQSIIINCPSLHTNVLNGQPVVRFDGTNDVFRLVRSAATNNFTVFVVASTTSWQDVDPERTAGSGGSDQKYVLASVSGVGNNAGANLSVSTNAISAYEWQEPLQNLPATAVYGGPVGTNASIIALTYSNRVPTIFLNGAVMRSGQPSVRQFVLAPDQLGGQIWYDGSQVYYLRCFQGDVAEVLIFNRVLSTSEMDAVGGYLNGRYGVVRSLPNTPTNVTAITVSSNQIALTWANPATNAARFRIERKLGMGGSYQEIATLNSFSTSYFDTALASNSQCYYRVQTENLFGDSDYSSEASANTSTNLVTLPAGDLRLWLQADAAAQANNGGLMSWWCDQSGYKNDACQFTTSRQPKLISSRLNNRPVLRFDGLDDYVQTLFTAATNDFTVFLIASTSLLRSVDTETNYSTGGDSGQRYVLANHTSAGTTFGGSGISLGTNGISVYEYQGYYSQAYDLYPAQAVYNGTIGTNASLITLTYSSRTPQLLLNGLLVRSGLTSLRPFVSAPNLIGGDKSILPEYFNGDVAEVMIFNRVLTGSETVTVGKYLLTKYGLTPFVANSAPPTTPTNFMATGLGPLQLQLAWQRASNDESSVIIERKFGAGGAYQQLGSVLVGSTNYLDTTALPTNTYYYRVRSENLFGQSTNSPLISPPTINLTNPPDLSSSAQNLTNTLTAIAADAYGTVTNVKFFVATIATNSVGVLTAGPYVMTWVTNQAGTYRFTAKASDNQGNSQYSLFNRLTIFPDRDGDGVGDYQEILNGTDPTVSNNLALPPSNPGDHTPPDVILTEPASPTLLP